MSLQLGILLALLCAFASNLAFLYKHRGACTACSVDIRHPLRTAVSLWSQKWFAIGMLVGGGAWLLHVAAISIAPLSVVQAVLSGGVVLLAVMAERLFGLGALLIMGPRLGAPAEHHGVMLAAASGILFGVCNVGVKALTGILGSEGVLALLLTPWTYVAIAGSIGAFYASARSLQDGEAVAVIAITGTAANISGIAGGILVFGDPLPSTAVGIAVQGLAFVLVIVASALTPAPVRAAHGAPAAAAAT